jgi:bifunctional ADP-heptose synthase (sugar kinase/adenylyltransferase)
MSAQTEDELVNEIALVFHDAMSVRCVPSDYAKAVITKVREFDRARAEGAIACSFDPRAVGLMTFPPSSPMLAHGQDDD